MRNTPALAVLVAVLSVAACTGGDPERSSGSPTPSPSLTTSTPPSEPPPPDRAQLAPALLERGHLGRGFTRAVETEAGFHTVFDDPEGRFGCLRRLDTVDYGVPEERTAMTVFDAKNSAKTPHLVHLVGSADSASDAEAGFDEAMALLRTCLKVRTRTEGVRVDAPVRTNRRKLLPAVDQQLNIRAVGTMRILRSTFPIGVWVSVVRIDRQVAIISLLDLDEDDADAQSELAEAAVRRLDAVLSGRPSPEVRQIRLETRLPR